MVLEMCDTLGIITDGTTPEFYMLWLPVEALSAPLPPLWRLMTEGGEGGAKATTYYEHSVTKQRKEQHPLLPVFIDQVKYERNRKDRPRPWSALEHWMLFSGSGKLILKRSAMVFRSLSNSE